MSKPKIKDIIVKTIETFCHAAIGYVIAHISGMSFNDGNVVKPVLTGIAISSVAAGVTAVWNGVISPMLKGGVKDEQDK